MTDRPDKPAWFVSPTKVRATSITGGNAVHMERTPEGNILVSTEVLNPTTGKFDVRGGLGIFDLGVLKAAIDLLEEAEGK